MPTSRLAPLLATCSLVALTGVVGGCAHSEGGNMQSMDRFTYVSTSYQPKTLVLLDTRDGEEIWSVDVPVGQKLVVQFEEGKAKNATPENPDLMKWELGSADQSRLTLRNAIPVPPASARRIDMTLRDTPEWPADDAD